MTDIIHIYPPVRTVYVSLSLAWGEGSLFDPGIARSAITPNEGPPSDRREAALPWPLCPLWMKQASVFAAAVCRPNAAQEGRIPQTEDVRDAAYKTTAGAFRHFPFLFKKESTSAFAGHIPDKVSARSHKHLLGFPISLYHRNICICSIKLSDNIEISSKRRNIEERRGVWLLQRRCIPCSVCHIGMLYNKCCIINIEK